MMKMHSSSIDPQEVEKFSLLAEGWWDEDGKLKALHDLNPLRIQYIRDRVIKHFDIKQGNLPFSNMDVVDVGCGGGLLTVPLSRMGANILGIDVAEDNIRIANHYKMKHGLGDNLNFALSSVESLSNSGKQFDMVLAMEVIEHVSNLDTFLEACGNILKPGGLIFISTLNKTLKSYLMAILGAEYFLRLVPVGTHDWKKFVYPSEIDRIFSNNKLSTLGIIGMKYNPILRKWYSTRDTGVNYMMYAAKKS